MAPIVPENVLPQLLVVAGITLVILEALAPGAHFIVLGVALLFAGLIGLVFPALGGPLALSALVLGVGAITFYVYREFDFYGGKGQAQTSDSDSLKGATGRVTEQVTATGGEVKLESGGFNPYYRARAIDGEIPEGEEVMVVDPGGGNVLTVEAMSTLATDDIDRELERAAERASDPDPDADREPEKETETG